MSELQVRYTALVRGVDQLVGRLHAQQSVVEDVSGQVMSLQHDADVLALTSAALQELLKVVSVESLAAIEQLESYGLRVIFDDQSLLFKIETTTKRGLQWMEPKLVQGDVEAPILDAFGGGPASVVAFLLRVLVCRRLGLAPVLLLDEPFSMVSAEYVPNVGKLLHELADKLGMTFIVVTHERGFLEHAHHAYEAQETSTGTVFKEVGNAGG